MNIQLFHSNVQDNTLAELRLHSKNHSLITTSIQGYSSALPKLHGSKLCPFVLQILKVTFFYTAEDVDNMAVRIYMITWLSESVHYTNLQPKPTFYTR